MNFKQCWAMLVLPVAMLISGGSYAAVSLPALDINKLVDDTGADLRSFSFNIDATAVSIVTGGAPIDIADESFILTSTSTSGFDQGKASFFGDFTVGSLLSGTFTDLQVKTSVTGGSFLGGVTYTGGSLMGSLTGGSLEGGFIVADLTATTLGTVAVVPVPAAVWLFSSGLIGLVGFARRKA